MGKSEEFEAATSAPDAAVATRRRGGSQTPSSACGGGDAEHRPRSRSSPSTPTKTTYGRTPREVLLNVSEGAVVETLVGNADESCPERREAPQRC